MADEDIIRSRYEWERLMRRVPLKPLTKYVGMVLAQYANSDGTNAFPSVAKLARVTCLSERSVRNALADLRAQGLIKRVQKGGLRGTQPIPDVHCLTIPVDFLERFDLLTPGEDLPPNRQQVPPGNGPDDDPNRHEVPVGDGPNRHVVPPNRHVTTSQPANDDTPTGTTCLLPITTDLPADPIPDQLGSSVPDATTTEGQAWLFARLSAMDELDALRKRKAAGE